MSLKTFRLRNGVNRVRVGSIVIDERGYTANDPLEEQLLDSHPDLTTSSKTTSKNTAAKARKPRPAKAAPATLPPADEEGSA